ncbi:MAG TPA: GGDEF domain-containing protein [Longimicrobiales bacterium]|nr:GGDEF domain-containing protein [Longimicrobiales bacterium]
MGVGRSAIRAGLAIALAAGAPGGWLLIQWLRGSDPVTQLQDHPDLYAYMMLGTAVVFLVFGLLLGQREDRLLATNIRLEDLSLTDALTGLRNGRYFHSRLEEEVSEAARTGEPLAVVVLDLDHFKRINDTYGHPVGDDVLVSVGRAIASSTRAGETEARVGGEEFALLLPGSTGQMALEAAERVRHAISRAETPLRDTPGTTIRMTASGGVASTAETSATTARALYQAADQALYRAKESGRDRTVVAGQPSPPASR